MSNLDKLWKSKATKLPPEVDVEGNVEYKRRLNDVSPERLEHLTTQLKWRLSEGDGQAYYELGVADDGIFIGLDSEELKGSLATLNTMATSLDADLTIVNELIVPNTNRKAVEALVRRRLFDGKSWFSDIRIVLIGSHSSGKSTILGCLTHGIQDNGRGKSRLSLLRHRHEIETGRTSSISHEIIGFQSDGTIVNFNQSSPNLAISWEQICSSSDKIVSFLDTCGHPKYMKTTIRGLTGKSPDYAILVISAESDTIPQMTKEHLGLATMLKIPIMIVLNKIDLIQDNPSRLNKVFTKLIQLLQSVGNNLTPVVISDNDSIETYLTDPSAYLPILLISSVTGENFDLFINLLSKLPATHTQESHTDKEHAEFHVEEVFSVPSAGTVIGGTLLNGMIKSDPNALYHLGPNQNGEFVSVKIKSIYRHRIATQMVRPGQSATLAIVHKVNSDGEIDQPLDADLSIRSGMVLLGCLTPPSVYYEFEADVTVLYHANVLKALFETMIHCGSICQSAKIVNIKKCKDGDNFSSSSESQRIAGKMGLRTGERGLIKFRFCRRPEFLKLGSPLVIREGNNKLIGKITKVG